MGDDDALTGVLHPGAIIGPARQGVKQGVGGSPVTKTIASQLKAIFEAKQDAVSNSQLRRSSTPA